MTSEPNPPGTAVVDAWNQHRQRVLDVAYRMLGTLSDAEDVLQETFARLSRLGTDGIDDVLGWLITTSGRVCLDRLRSDTSRRRYIGPWLPEPLVELPGRETDPADRVTLDDSVRLALMVVLESLSPAERTVYILHEVFAMTFEEVAVVVGRTAPACRQLASRARRRIAADHEPRMSVDRTAANAVAQRFAAPCAGGDLHALIAVLDDDVVGAFDSGGRIPGAPLTIQIGAPTVGITLAHAFAGAGASFNVIDVNGRPGVTVELHGRVMAVISIETDGHTIAAIQAIGNPTKLEHLNRRPDIV